MTEEDSAIHLRDRLLNWLGGRKTAEALRALKPLEQPFGAKYPWLRRPRSAVERAYRQWRWSPIPPATVALLLLDNSRTLIRNAQDAAEGIFEAIHQFERSLRHSSPSSLEDLWNTPRAGPPSPKADERVSDKLCEAIRQYFTNHAVVADREVQVFRRSVPRKAGGAPGSEVDVLVRVPGPGTVGGEPIGIPIEVKRSSNPEARTGLREQLVGRYMRELGTDYGVFIVVWLKAPGLSKAHQPIWPDLEQGRADLEQQVGAIGQESEGSLHVSAVVVDASLA